MFHIALYEPEIPPNTGNIIRLCANSGAELHLIHPLGFELNEKRLRRAGLDYIDWSRVHEYEHYYKFLQKINNDRLFACTTKGKTVYSNVHYQAGDVLLFGPESRGLPAEIRLSLPPEQQIKIPMKTASRSINLANAVSIILFEAWRQFDFEHRFPQNI